jgi:hypothetical protein
VPPVRTPPREPACRACVLLEEDRDAHSLVEEDRKVERVGVLVADRAQHFLGQPLEILDLAVVDGRDRAHPQFVHLAYLPDRSAAGPLRTLPLLPCRFVPDRMIRRQQIRMVCAGPPLPHRVSPVEAPRLFPDRGQREAQGG